MPDLSCDQIQAVRATAARLGWKYAGICAVEDQVQSGFLRVLEYLDAHPGVDLDAATCAVLTRYSVFDNLRAASRGSRTLLAARKAREETEQRLTRTLLRPPTGAEMRAAGAPDVVEMFVPVPLEDLGALEDICEPPDPVEISEMLEALEDLPQRLRWVIQQLFLLERSAVDVAKDLNVTDGRVTQLKKEALKHLHRRLR